MADKYVSIYLSSRYDTDLIGLITEIGKKHFLQLTKASLLALNNPQYIGNAKEYLKKGNDIPSINNGCMTLHLSINDSRYNVTKDLLSHVKDRRQSAFIKQIIRYYLGPLNLLPEYFDEEVNLPTKELYTPLLVNGIINSTPKRVYKRVVINQVTQTAPNTLNLATEPISSQDKEIVNEPIKNQSEAKLEAIEPIQELVHVSNNNEENIPTESTTTNNSDDADEILALLNNILG